jgi:glycosyltransferase involved in cell wall biosynthesis
MLQTGKSIPHASVVIPTFNGAARLPRVLAALVAQTAPDGSFEVVVVDNASTDATATVARDDVAVAQLGARGIEVRVIAEPRQGLTYARIAGVAAARCDAVCFLDDDNLPDPDYIEQGISIFTDESLGLVISCARPRWETPPPASVTRRLHLLAINDFYMGDQPVDFGASATPAPTIGAGLWVRRSAFLKAVPWEHPELLMPDRVGQRLVSGGDIELGVLIGKAGYRRKWDCSQRIDHARKVRRRDVWVARPNHRGGATAQGGLRDTMADETRWPERNRVGDGGPLGSSQGSAAGRRLR